MVINDVFLQICFLLCCEREFMVLLIIIKLMSLEHFTPLSRYLDDLFNIDIHYFEQMEGHVFPTELQVNKDLDLSITNEYFLLKFIIIWGHFNFEILNFRFVMEMFLAPFLWCMH